MPVKQVLQIIPKQYLGKAHEFIQVTFPKVLKQKEYKAFIHYSSIMFINTVVYAGPHAQKIKETASDITKLILKIGNN